jgi:hypothetical protein
VRRLRSSVHSVQMSLKVRLIAQHSKANGASRGAEVQCEVLHAIGSFGIGATTRAARKAAVLQDYFKTLGVHPVCKNNNCQN